MKRFSVLFALLALPALAATPAGAQTPPAARAVLSAKTYGFLTHATFFSVETKQPNTIDPQVFVADPSAPGAAGPQNITHAAGYRPAFGVDDPSTTLSNATGAGIGFTLADWFAARGSATLTPSTDGATTTVAVTFHGLRPRARYSLFENHFGPAGVTFTPLDGNGKTSSFTSSPDGSAALTVTAPGPITHAEAVLLVFHSDGLDHGADRGTLGVNAHHQLIMRIP